MYNKEVIHLFIIAHSMKAAGYSTTEPRKKFKNLSPARLEDINIIP
jgi:hypothetical protein